MQNNLLNNILKYGVLMLSVHSVEPWLSFSIGPTFIWWSFYVLMIWTFVRLWDKSYNPFWYVIWGGCIIVSSIWGTTFCRDYWDWKQLVGNVFSYSICLATMVALSTESLQHVLIFLYKHIWKLFVLLVLFMSSDGISKFMLPFSFLALFYPLLNMKYRRYVWAGLLITVIFGYEGRSDILKFLFCMFLGLFSIRHEIVRYARKLYWVMYILPFLLFLFAATGTFNIFKIDEVLNISSSEDNHVQVIDTRTLLYEEVIGTALDRGTIFFGNSPARGYYSEWMIRNMDMSDIIGDEHFGERGKTECSVLNVFLHFGLMGVFIYLMLFWRASYLSIFKSNNIFIPIIGLYVAFRFLFGWVEDFSRFDLNMFFLWMMIGMCYSPHFREMTDNEFHEWFVNILS